MKLKGIHSICVIIVICAIIATIQAASAATTISVEPAYMEVSPGDTFTANITIDPDGAEVMGAQYTLYFDNALLNVVDQNKGTFLSHDGVGTSVYKNEINNTLGIVKYGEARSSVDYGVTNSGILATIEFEVRCSGTGELRLGNVKLSDPGAGPISTEVNNATVEIAQSQPSTSFMISGYVFYGGGSDCNDPTVNITNLNISKKWTAETNVTSNYYQLVRSSCADVIADEVLQFDVAGCSQSNTTSHTVTQAEVVAGGFKLNITLSAPVITSCDDGGSDKDEFCPGDNVSVRGTGLAPETEYTLWIQSDPVNDSDTLNASEDPSGSQENVTTDENGDFGPIEIWINISAGSQMNYDIVVDNQDGVYNAADDGIDSATTYGITAPIPELPGVVLVSIGLLGLAGLVWRRKDE